MAVTVNGRAYEVVKELISQGRFVLGDRDARSEHRLSARQENASIDRHGTGEYGDFAWVGRCGARSAEVRTGQYKHNDIKVAAAHLHGLLDAHRQASPPARKDK